MADLTWRLWVCLLLIVVMAGVILYLRGIDIRTVVLACVALICPAVVLWALFVAVGDRAKRSKKFPVPGGGKRH